jgi:hypothetical protein
LTKARLMPEPPPVTTAILFAIGRFPTTISAFLPGFYVILSKGRLSC